MQHEDVVRLIQQAIPNGPGVWADLGSGDGAFTFALRELGGPEFEIYSIDKSSLKLHTQEKKFKERFGEDPAAHFIETDFTRTLPIPQMDGIIMANSLHFIKDKNKFLTDLKKKLSPIGRLVIVEYDIDEGNHFVPYPLSFAALTALAPSAGFAPPQLLATAPSEYWRQIYAAMLERED